MSHSFGSALIAASIALAMIVGAPQTAQQRAAKDAPDVQIGAVSLDPQGQSVTVPVRFSKEALAGRGVETVHIGVLATTGAETSIVVSNREPHKAGNNQRQTFVLPLTAEEASRLQSAGSWTVAVTLTREQSGDPVVAWFDSATQTAAAPAAAAIVGPAPKLPSYGDRDCSGLEIAAGADVTDCIFAYAFLQHMDLSGSNFTNTRFFLCDFTRTSLRNANLDTTNFSYANLYEADLTGANLYFTSFGNARAQFAHFAGSKMDNVFFYQTDLTGANMRGLDLTGADLQGIYAGNVHFEDSNLAGAYLRGVDMTRARLTNANLEGARLAGAVLEDADLQGANLSGADAPGANFSRANANGAEFRGANLSRARFVIAKLRNTSFQQANLAHAVVTSADFTRANLAGANVAGFTWETWYHTILCRTTMPDGKIEKPNC